MHLGSTRCINTLSDKVIGAIFRELTRRNPTQHTPTTQYGIRAQAVCCISSLALCIHDHILGYIRCICVYMYLCMYVYVYKCICMRLYVYMYVYVYMYMYTNGFIIFLGSFSIIEYHEYYRCRIPRISHMGQIMIMIYASTISTMDIYDAIFY